MLTPQETEEIFEVLRRLAAEGHSIVFISHKLYEVLEIADRITVIRRGKVVGQRIPSETNEEDLAELMVGREVSADRRPRRVAPGATRRSASRASCVKDDRGHEVVHGIDLEVRAGEILGIAGRRRQRPGRAGRGARSGCASRPAGKVTLDGKDITGHGPRDVYAAGVAYVPGRPPPLRAGAARSRSPTTWS